MDWRATGQPLHRLGPAQPNNYFNHQDASVIYDWQGQTGGQTFVLELPVFSAKRVLLI